MKSYRVVSGLVLIVVSALVGARALSPAGELEHARVLAAGFALAAGIYLLATSRRAPAPQEQATPFQAPPPPRLHPDDLPRVDGPFLLGEILLTRLPRLRRLQVEAALRAQRGTGQRLGQIMVGMGLISGTELDDALRLQRRLRQGSPDSLSGGPYVGPRADANRFDFGAAEQ